MPPGWFPLLTGYDAPPPLPADLPELPREVLAGLGARSAVHFRLLSWSYSSAACASFTKWGLAVSSAGDEPEAESEENDEEEETLVVGARLPIPAETFIEGLSQKLEVHPISIYWLPQEGIEREAWRCLPEEHRLIEDRFTITVLRMLGHRWPRRSRPASRCHRGTDQDGVIPLTPGGGEKSLLERVRERIAEEFPGRSATNIGT